MNFDIYPNEIRYYPSYHFRPEKNWINDPNGLIWLDGWYHIFYQYNPDSDIWGNIHWGHAKSRDLIHWVECPLALYPDIESGEVHCYSGCAVHNQEGTHILYTSIGEGERGPETGAEQWSVVAEDKGLEKWARHKEMALSPDLHHPLQVTMWRDPFVWEENGGYHLLLSGSLRREGTDRLQGVILRYHSRDFKTWEFITVFYASEEYELIECPNLMKFEDQYLLLYSPMEAVRYALGTMDPVSKRFVVRQEGVFDYSIRKNGFYASNVYQNDPGGRYICFGCLFEGDRLNSAMKRGWAGMQSLPRKVWLAENHLQIWPAEECRILRQEGSRSDFSGDMICTKGRAKEFLIQVADQGRGILQIDLFSSDREKTSLSFDFGERRILLDRTDSTTMTDVDTEMICAPMSNRNAVLSEPYRQCEVVEIDIFIDHSSIEIFYNRSVTISARVFPSLDESVNHRIIPDGLQGSAEIYDLSL